MRRCDLSVAHLEAIEDRTVVLPHARGFELIDDSDHHEQDQAHRT